MTSIPRPPVHRIALVQFGLTFVIAAVLMVLLDKTAALSALSGGLICAIPNGYFIWQAFKYSGARSAAKIVPSFYQGEAWKFMLTALGFAAVFISLKPLNVWALFGTFITVQFSHVVASRIYKL